MGSAAFGMRRIADLIEKKTAPVAIIGSKGVEAGIAVKLVESDSNYKLFDGIFLAGYGPPKVGCARFKNDIFEPPAARPEPLPPRSKPELHFFPVKSMGNSWKIVDFQGKTTIFTENQAFPLKNHYFP